MQFVILQVPIEVRGTRFHFTLRNFRKINRQQVLMNKTLSSVSAISSVNDLEGGREET